MTLTSYNYNYAFFFCTLAAYMYMYDCTRGSGKGLSLLVNPAHQAIAVPLPPPLNYCSRAIKQLYTNIRIIIIKHNLFKHRHKQGNKIIRYFTPYYTRGALLSFVTAFFSLSFENPSMDPSSAPRSLPLRLAGGRGSGGESDGADGAAVKVQKVVTTITRSIMPL